jgi:hypothetical protein
MVALVNAYAEQFHVPPYQVERDIALDAHAHDSFWRTVEMWGIEAAKTPQTPKK